MLGICTGSLIFFPMFPFFFFCLSVANKNLTRSNLFGLICRLSVWEKIQTEEEEEDTDEGGCLEAFNI